MQMRKIFPTLITFLIVSIAGPCGAIVNGTNQSNIDNTCADPSLTNLFISVFSPSRTAHAVRLQADMIAFDTTVGTTDNFQFQGPAFRAWSTPQEFTVPFHQLGRTDGQDFLFLPEINGTLPTASEFGTGGIVGYAYSTQVCGSVPLFVASNAASTDHWWTTSPNEHAAMLTQTGWVDAGIAFYVLPLDCNCSA